MSDGLATAERRHVFLGQDGPGEEFAGNDQFAMRLVGPQSRWSLRIAPDEASNHPSAGGFDLTQPINQLRTTTDAEGQLMSCRLGPDEWLLVADTETPGTQLGAHLGAVPHTLVDVSHRNIGLELTGSAVRDILNTGCLLNFSDSAFPVGTVTRTFFSKAEVILARCPDSEHAPKFRVECWRSFARYLCAHFLDSTRLLGHAD